MTVLLTGGTGFIGSHTAVALLQAGERVVLLDNLINSSAEIVSRVEVITGQPIVFVQVDVRDTTAVKQALVAIWLRGRRPFCWAQGRRRISSAAIPLL